MYNVYEAGYRARRVFSPKEGGGMGCDWTGSISSLGFIQPSLISCFFCAVDLASYPGLPSQLFFVAMEKSHAFFHGCEKSCEGRPGYEPTIIPYKARL